MRKKAWMGSCHLLVPSPTQSLCLLNYSTALHVFWHHKYTQYSFKVKETYTKSTLYFEIHAWNKIYYNCMCTCKVCLYVCTHMIGPCPQKPKEEIMKYNVGTADWTWVFKWAASTLTHCAFSPGLALGILNYKTQSSNYMSCFISAESTWLAYARPLAQSWWGGNLESLFTYSTNMINSIFPTTHT